MRVVAVSIGRHETVACAISTGGTTQHTQRFSVVQSTARDFFLGEAGTNTRTSTSARTDTSVACAAVTSTDMKELLSSGYNCSFIRSGSVPTLLHKT